jgi:epoxyqueuosine reductase
MTLKPAIFQAARDLGFDEVSVAPLVPPDREARALEEWCEAGRHGEMNYMERTVQIRTRPQELLPGAESLLVLGVSYYTEDPPPAPEPAGAWGRVARYAWGLDYHEVIQERLERLCAQIEAIRGKPFSSRAVTDAQPLLERAYAYEAGLGFYGKNTNIIVPGGGSWLFLAELILDFPLEPDAPAQAQGCGSCRLCVNACPTGALSGDYKMDARKCISYLTIENKGVIPRELRPALGAWVFGCDICQERCPYNVHSKESQWPEFSNRRGVGPWLDLRSVLSLKTQKEFTERFKGTPLTRPKRKGLLRNACVAAGNLRSEELIGPLAALLRDDPEPLVRLHAAWALGRYPEGAVGRSLKAAWSSEEEREVRGEIELSIEAA